MVGKTGREVQSLARGLDTLVILAEADQPLGVTEIAQILKVDKSSAFRLLHTLVGYGLVVQDNDTRRYRLGLRIVELSRQALDCIELRVVAKPWLRKLQQRTGESAHLAVLSEGHVVYVEQEESNATLNVNTEIGRHGPLHCTAIGKALIAHLSPEDVARVLGQAELTRYTPRTMTTLRELIPHLESVRARGYAVDDEEFDSGVRGVGAVIHDFRDEVVASIGVSGPSVRVTLERVPELGEIVVQAAEQVSRLIGYQEA